MFVRIADEGRASIEDRAPIPVLIDGAPFEGRPGDSIATVLLLAGKAACRRNFVSGEPRGPYCMMGVCFECLVRVDGIDGLQACMIPIRPDMRIETSIAET